jgi:protein-S-isoprenylcysteine O-methyltransferase Ste14
MTFVFGGLDHRREWSSVSAAVVFVADGVLVLGLLIVFATFRHNSYAGSTVEVAAGQTVADAGPYAWVRHPMYLGSVLAFLATPAALGSAYAWLGAVPAILALMVRLVDEERLLRAQLPGYAAYGDRVRFRLMPGIW